MSQVFNNLSKWLDAKIGVMPGAAMPLVILSCVAAINFAASLVMVYLVYIK